jgi:hypothetical protein
MPGDIALGDVRRPSGPTPILRSASQLCSDGPRYNRAPRTQPSMHFLLVTLLSASVQTIVVPRQASSGAHVRCPLNATTRIYLPEPLRQLKLGPEAKQQLGVSIERTKPQAILSVTPRTHPARATIQFRGPHLVLSLTLETQASGASADVHLVLDTQPTRSVAASSALSAPASAPSPLAISTPEPEPTPAPVIPIPSAVPSPTPVSSPTPEPTPNSAPTPSVAFDLGDLVRATPVPIGRREGLPGQLALVLVDALKGESYVWLRFTLEGGAAQRVRAVSWQRGAISAFTQEPVGKDLRVVVQLPRAELDRKARVQLELGSGAAYRVSLNASTLAGFLKSLFQ